MIQAWSSLYRNRLDVFWCSCDDRDARLARLRLQAGRGWDCYYLRISSPQPPPPPPSWRCWSGTAARPAQWRRPAGGGRQRQEAELCFGVLTVLSTAISTGLMLRSSLNEKWNENSSELNYSETNSLTRHTAAVLSDWLFQKSFPARIDKTPHRGPDCWREKPTK